MAYFYENKKDRFPGWEDVGGFNAHLLMEIRSALMDVESDSRPAPQDLKDAVSLWIRRHPEFEFPDDEIG
ncbi:MAG: hypothetical protein M1550_04345 [Deltaproteobacteria bacterium]|nr:hypothetical protein [Deltaproteobacteria bacterium]